MRLLALVAASLLLPQEKNEAEELFKKMEEKFAKAATLSVKMKGTVDSNGTVMDVESEITLAEGNRARAEFKLTAQGQTRSSEVVSDGKTTRVVPMGGGVPQTFPTIEKLGALLARGLARGGAVPTISAFSTARDVKADPDRNLTAKDFTLGAKEKIGDRDTQVVAYKLSGLGLTDIDVNVWIDLKTYVPVKRLMTAKAKRNVTEEASLECTFDEKIDAAKFELPKEAK